MNSALRNNRGYCRQVTSEALVLEITSAGRHLDGPEAAFDQSAKAG